MKYLENAFKFLGKFYMLLIPLFVAIAIPAIISGPSSNALSAQIKEIQNSLLRDPSMIQNTSDLFELYATLGKASASLGLASLLSFILLLIVRPATYGMVNKALATGNAGLNDFVPEMKNNIGKYILYGLANIVIYIGIGIATAILIGIFAALTAASKALGVLLIVLFIIALVIGIIVYAFFITLWFPAMVSDNLGVFDGLKKSFSVVKSYFWPIVGITILISIGSSVVNLILGLFSSIPVIGSILISLVAALVEFIMIAFYFEVYRDKTGKVEYMNEELNFETPGDYL